VHEYHLAAGDIAAAVRRNTDAYRGIWVQRGCALSVEIMEGAPPVCFDTDAVSQAVLNLLDNAIKYSGDAPLIGVRLYAQGGEVVVAVKDSGIGVPQSEHEKIFSAFYRMPSTSHIGGYGLGLYLVRHIMTAHGGHVELQSGVGSGSEFRLHFPVYVQDSDC
jgi:two-component system phosphate regulon sensor histidine kinase PhoR